MYLLLCASHFKSQRCYVFATLCCTVNSRARRPEWSQLQLDLFLSLFGLVSSLALSALCIMYESVIQLDHMIRSMCSILGMNTIVTMVCYCMCLSLILQSLTLLKLFTYCILFKYFIFSLKQLLIA